MSFISKLFRRTGSPAATAPLSEEVAAQFGVIEPPAAGATEQDQPTPDGAEPALNGGAQPEPRQDPQPPDEADTAWWEESAPVVVSAEPAALASEAAEPGPTTIADTADASANPAPEAEEPDEGEGGTRMLATGELPALVALRSHRGLAAAAQRDIGRVRSVNQDSVFAMVSTLPRESGDVTIGLYMVADGMGGHHGGEIASRMAVSTVVRQVLADLVVPALTDDTTEALQPIMIAAVQEANRTIWEHAQSVGSDMGTTCTVALLLGRSLYIGHVGDTRAYLLTPTDLRLITSDHSTVGRLIQLGQLEPSEAREHPLRSQLYRTVGQQAEIMVDFIYQPIGDATHLLIGSDGLWGMLDEDVIRDVLEHTLWPQDACHELIARANLAGGDDNISAVVVTLPVAAS
jgi:serine/threonine protein phosphatase PrpC